MRKIQHSTKTEVQKAGKKGRGIFAVSVITKGEIIEIAAYIRLSVHDHNLVKKSDLICYIFNAGRGEAAVGLGTSSLYNHADDANADYDLDRKTRTIQITAARDINFGEEVTIDYGYHPAKPST